MFPSTPDQPRTAPRSLRAVLRDAADLTIAFVTLESYGLDDLRRGDDARHGTPEVEGDTRARLELTSTHDDAPAAGPRIAGHPHRTDLRVPARLRRPGASIAQEQLCLTPLRSRAPQDHPSPAPSPRRRTAPQDAPH